MRGKLVLVAIWALGVVATSLVTWRAIDAAGQQILTDPYQGVLSSSRLLDGSGDPSGGSTTGVKQGGGKTSTKGTHVQKKKSKDQTGSTNQSTAPASSITRTWRDTPGYVVASCQGSVLTVNSVTPNNGYKAEVGDDSSTGAKVHFEPRGDQGAQLNLLITCSGGQPQFSAQTDN